MLSEKGRAEFRAIYVRLMRKKTLTGLTADDALKIIGLLADASFYLEELDGIRHARKLARQLSRRKLGAKHRGNVHYSIGNTWGDERALKTKSSSSAWEWQQRSLEQELLNFRIAANESTLKEVDSQRGSQILTNLGNALDHTGRFVEAIEQWDLAIAKEQHHGMPVGNRGQGLIWYARHVYDDGHRTVLIHAAYNALQKALKLTTHPEAAFSYQRDIEWIQSLAKNKKGNLEANLTFAKFSLGRSKTEREYRQWCLANRLFLNPLNDLGPHSIAAHDILSTPDIVVRLKTGPKYQGYFNQIKQEYVSARYWLYQGLTAARPHFSDRKVLLINTLDYPSYSHSVEQAKAAFRVSFSILDKIAFFLNDYLELGIKPRDVTFRTMWYERRTKRSSLRIRGDFRKLQNLPLRGLFWLSKDIYENRKSFKSALQPDAQEMLLIRNCLEHRYLKLHEEMWRGPPTDEFEMSMADTLAHSVYRTEFENKAMRMFKLARAAIIYLSLGICRQETLRSEKRPDGLIMPLITDVWEDDWKL